MMPFKLTLYRPNTKSWLILDGKVTENLIRYNSPRWEAGIINMLSNEYPIWLLHEIKVFSNNAEI